MQRKKKFHLEALVCTVKRFHKYLFGQKFTIFTDHKPLIGIFGKEGRNSIFVTRLQRYVLELSIYDYDIKYRPGGNMGNADFCSRFSLRHSVPAEYDKEIVNSLNFNNDFPVDFSQVANETKGDTFLQTIIKF